MEVAAWLLSNAPFESHDSTGPCPLPLPSYQRGQTPLHVAVAEDRVSSVSHLLSYGADRIGLSLRAQVRAMDGNLPRLHHSYYRTSCFQSGVTALMLALSKGNRAIIDKLHAAGAA